MAQSEVLNKSQFSRTAASGDPAITTKAKAHFTQPESKTMRVSGGKLPSKQKTHIHHRKNAPRTRRAH